MQQLPLFPDAFEIRSRAVAAMRSLDTTAALALVERARSQASNLVDIDHLQSAIRWLDARLRAVSPPGRTPAGLAPLLVEVARDCLAERLTHAAMTFVDEMADLLPEVFPRYILACQEREREP